MKTQIKVQKIKDPNTTIEINSPAHRIEEIKREIATNFSAPETAKAEVLEMFNNDE